MTVTKTRKKLIEVALPLDAINKASVREKSIRHGHPSTLHLWWARRPLAAARAVLFAQLVDDPSSWPGVFPTEQAQAQQRRHLFGIIEELVKWENTTNEQVLEKARAAIRESWRETCRLNRDHPQAATLFDPECLPACHDPFAGGGAIPLEAQRLGLESHASDLNPVAVMINKAMLEIPPRFAGRKPVGPLVPGGKQSDLAGDWPGARGLAEDLRRYGHWMREEAAKRIGHLYPKVSITGEMARAREDLKPCVGKELTVIAWLWARTVKSPNPAFSHVAVPLVHSFVLSSKKGKEAWVEPVIENDSYRFEVHTGRQPEETLTGTVRRTGGICLLSGVAMPLPYIRKEAKEGRMGARLMTIVAEGNKGRVYLSPTMEMVEIAELARPENVPESRLPDKALGFRVQEYGMIRHRDLFTPRQLVALTTFSDLVHEAREKAIADAKAAGMPDDGVGIDAGGTGATAYGDALAVYLGFVLDKVTDYWSSICSWHSSGEKMRSTFGRQAIPMVWDYAEANPFCSSTGNWLAMVDWVWKALMLTPGKAVGFAVQQDAATQTVSNGKVISTDPPYYDNIGYADLSDFFYVWLRRSLRKTYPDLFSTMVAPKAEELVATPYRHGSREKAEHFFMDGMTRVIRNLAKQAHPAFPVTIYYAFKQSETREEGTASTGWETFLEAVIRSGFTVEGTWPMRTEMTNRMVGIGTNALASSVVLVCRKRETRAEFVSRREWVTALRDELPAALTHLQRGNVAPVDLAQAAIGPGMAVYTRYGKVLDAEGKAVTVREALALINQTLDEALTEQEGDFDADSRWALAWFEQHGFAVGEYGVAETLSKAKNTSVSGLVEAGILESKAGKVRLLTPGELPVDWDPRTDTRLTAWEMVHHLVRVLDTGGEKAAADLVESLGGEADIARELCYRLYTVCERKKQATVALMYNGLVRSWPEIARLVREASRQKSPLTQAALFNEA